MPNTSIRVGFIGLNPDSHWAATAHMPALASLGDSFRVVGVANSTYESAQRTAAAFNLQFAFTDANALVRSPEVDLVVVTVKVPYHFELVSAAIDAGKHVHCEWPLGNGLAEAEKLAALAQKKGVVATIGTQARFAPEILHVQKLLAEGYVGQVLSSSIIADGANWADRTSRELAYLYDSANGATMLTIPFGHTLAAVRDVLGEITDLKSQLSIRQPKVTIEETGAAITKTAADDIMVIGRTEGGATLSMHYRGGISRGTNLLWEIHGTEGDIQISGPFGHAQMVQLAVNGRKRGQDAFEPLMPPASAYEGLPDSALVRNVACIYARIADDIRNGTQSAPSFQDGVALHRVLDRIEQGSAI